MIMAMIYTNQVFPLPKMNHQFFSLFEFFFAPLMFAYVIQFKSKYLFGKLSDDEDRSKETKNMKNK